MNTDVEVLPCNNPPGISLVVKFNGNILVDQIITKSQKIDLFGDVVAVNVTLNQLDEAIGIEVGGRPVQSCITWHTVMCYV